MTASDADASNEPRHTHGPDSGRSDYLAEVTGRLWPAPGSGTEEYLLLPSAAQPRLLVPLGDRRAAVAAIRTLAVRHSLGRRLGLRLLLEGFRWGVAPRLLRQRLVLPAGRDSLVEALSRELAAPVRVALYIGPPRANRKPVLQVIGADGEVVAYAKVGTTALAAELVRIEAATLTRLAERPLRTVQVPRLMAELEYDRMPVVVQSPLPVRQQHARGSQVQDAMVEVSGLEGSRRAPWAGSTYRARLRAGASGVSADPRGRTLAAMLDAVDHTAGSLTFGAWHGDWNSGNFGMADGRVLVWDWERFGIDVPVGFDALHKALQDDVTVHGRPLPAAVGALCAGAPGLLRPWALSDEEARTTLALYLIEVGVRYLRDRQDEAGAPVGRIEQWLLPVLSTLLAVPATTTQTGRT